MGISSHGKSIGLHYEQWVEDIPKPVEVYVSLQFNWHTCQIDAERYYFDDGHEAVRRTAELTDEDCFGDEAAELEPTSEKQLWETCLSHFVNDELKKFTACFHPDIRAFINGEDVSYAVQQPAFWREWTEYASFESVELVDAVKQTNRDRLSVAQRFDYYLVDDNKRKLHELYAAYAMEFSEDGRVLTLFGVHGDERLLAAAAGDLAAVQAPDLMRFTYIEAALEYSDIVRQFGRPTQFAHTDAVARTQGLVYWAEIDAPHCFGEAHLRDEAITVGTSMTLDGNDQPHATFLTVALNVDLSKSQWRTIHNISNALVYSRVSKQLIVREATVGAAVALGYVAMRVAEGTMELDDAIAFKSARIAEVYEYNEDGTINRNPDTNTIRYSTRFDEFRERMCDIAMELNK